MTYSAARYTVWIMIKSYKNSKTERVHLAGTPKGFKGLDGARAVRILDLLEAATSLDELPRLASYRLHKLSRDRKDQWSITINLPLVVCFTLVKSGGWKNVEIVDYH